MVRANRLLCSLCMTAGARGRLVLQQRADAAQPSLPLSLPLLLSLTTTRPPANLQIRNRSLPRRASSLPVFLRSRGSVAVSLARASRSKAVEHDCACMHVKTAPWLAHMAAALQRTRTRTRTRTCQTPQDKLRLQTLIRHFFFEIQKEGGAGDANTAAARAVERARTWIAENGPSTPLPSSS